MDDYEIPVVDLTAWMGDQGDVNCDGRADDCQRLADALHRFGIVLVRDPRVSEVDNDKFLDQMETYYERSDGVKDARPEVIHLKSKYYRIILSEQHRRKFYHVGDRRVACGDHGLYSRRTSKGRCLRTY